MFYFYEPVLIVSVLGAVLAHELGHILSIYIQGFYLRAITLELGGPCIFYSGKAEGWGLIISVLSGPAAGLLWAAGFSYLSAEYGYDFCGLTAGISLALSLFNLLPMAPLDGGQALRALLSLVFGRERGEAAAMILSIMTGAALISAGLFLAIKGCGCTVFAAALIVCAVFCRTEMMNKAGYCKNSGNVIQ